jgi:hypothetical protein
MLDAYVTAGGGEFQGSSAWIDLRLSGIDEIHRLEHRFQARLHSGYNEDHPKYRHGLVTKVISMPSSLHEQYLSTRMRNWWHDIGDRIDGLLADHDRRSRH